MVVVVGGSGHLGNNLVRALLKKGTAVRCLVLENDNLKPLSGLDIETVKGDVRDYGSLLRAFLGADVVYHLASVISLLPGRSRLLEEVNVKGARNVAEACLATGVRRLVYTSSIHALVEPPHGVAIDESMPCDPSRITMEYSKSKARGTLEVLGVAEKGLDVVVVLPTGIMGPYDVGPSEAGKMVLDFAQGKIPVTIDGGYDFVDVRDVAEGHIAAAELGKRGERYILSGEWISVDSVFTEVSNITGRPMPQLRVPPWVATAMASAMTTYGVLTGTKPSFNKDSLATLRSNSKVTCDKAKRILGYKARPIRETIRDVVQWFGDAGLLEVDKA